MRENQFSELSMIEGLSITVTAVGLASTQPFQLRHMLLGYSSSLKAGTGHFSFLVHLGQKDSLLAIIVLCKNLDERVSAFTEPLGFL